MLGRVTEYLARPFKNKRSKKILVYDDYSEKILSRYEIITEGDFWVKYNIVACEHINNLIEKNIHYDVVYVLERACVEDIIKANRHLGDIYINYFKTSEGNIDNIYHIIIDKFRIIGNVIIMDRDISLHEVIRILDLPFTMYYERGMQEIGTIDHIPSGSNLMFENSVPKVTAHDTLIMVRRRSNILSTLKFKSRLVDFVFDHLEDEIIESIMGNSTATDLLKEIWTKPICEGQSILKEKFSQFKKDNDLARFELKEISVTELNRSTSSSLISNIKDYNKTKTAYKLLFVIISKCITTCNSSLEINFSLLEPNRHWSHVYNDIKPIVEYVNNNGIKSLTEFYKLFGLMEYYGQNWRKLVCKLTKKYNLKFDKLRFPSRKDNIEEVRMMVGVSPTNMFPKSLKLYKYPRMDSSRSMRLYYIDDMIWSHDVVDPNTYYIGFL